MMKSNEMPNNIFLNKTYTVYFTSFSFTIPNDITHIIEGYKIRGFKK